MHCSYVFFLFQQINSFILMVCCRSSNTLPVDTCSHHPKKYKRITAMGAINSTFLFHFIRNYLRFSLFPFPNVKKSANVRVTLLPDRNWNFIHGCLQKKEKTPTNYVEVDLKFYDNDMCAIVQYCKLACLLVTGSFMKIFSSKIRQNETKTVNLENSKNNLIRNETMKKKCTFFHRKIQTNPSLSYKYIHYIHVMYSLIKCDKMIFVSDSWILCGEKKIAQTYICQTDRKVSIHERNILYLFNVQQRMYLAQLHQHHLLYSK